MEDYEWVEGVPYAWVWHKDKKQQSIYRWERIILRDDLGRVISPSQYNNFKKTNINRKKPKGKNNFL